MEAGAGGVEVEEGGGAGGGEVEEEGGAGGGEAGAGGAAAAGLGCGVGNGRRTPHPQFFYPKSNHNALIGGVMRTYTTP